MKIMSELKVKLTQELWGILSKQSIKIKATFPRKQISR